MIRYEEWKGKRIPPSLSLSPPSIFLPSFLPSLHSLPLFFYPSVLPSSLTPYLPRFLPFLLSDAIFPPSLSPLPPPSYLPSVLSSFLPFILFLFVLTLPSFLRPLPHTFLASFPSFFQIQFPGIMCPYGVNPHTVHAKACHGRYQIFSQQGCPSTKYSVSEDMPVGTAQSKRIFQLEIFSQRGCSSTKYSVSEDVPVPNI
jgi:hypothetical protein